MLRRVNRSRAAAVPDLPRSAEELAGLVSVELQTLRFDEPHHEHPGRQILVTALLERVSLGGADRRAAVAVIGNPSVLVVLDQQGKLAL